MDGITIHPRYVGGCHTVDICSYNSHGDGVDIGDGHMTPNGYELTMALTGIVLVSLIVVFWL